MKRTAILIVFGILVPTSLSAQRSFPPSQRELNGFLLHQYHQAISASMGQLAHETRSEDGWIDRIYWIDDNHEIYMVFGFPDSSHGCAAIQITGKSQTSMLPFLGLRLGDPRDFIYLHIGKPSSTKYLDDVHRDLYEYEDRNYSFEVDQAGVLMSIRIMDGFGFRNVPAPDTTTTLEWISSTLRNPDVDTLLSMLCGDVEFSAPGLLEYCTFKRSARSEMADTSSLISQLLYAGPRSVRALLSPLTIKSAEMNIRVLEKKGAGIVYKFPASTGIKEMVLFEDAGRFRIWEVKLD